MTHGDTHSNLRGFNLLLAEDCPDSQALLSTILGSAGAKVTCVSNGAEALQAALEAARNRSPFDLVLLDVQMPEMDGLSAARSLRESGYHAPIVAMTARSTQRDREKSMAAGCDEHLSKLSGSKVLLSHVKQILTEHTRVKALELPALPLVPEMLTDNPQYARSVLTHLDKLPGLMKQLEREIGQANFIEVISLTQQISPLSLFGYNIFSEHLLKMQLAAEEQDLPELTKIFKKLHDAARDIIAGRAKVREIAAQVNSH